MSAREGGGGGGGGSGAAAELNLGRFDAVRKECGEDRAFRVAQASVAKSGVVEAATTLDGRVRAGLHAYDKRVSHEMKATSQKSTGRCWIFACLNVMRSAMSKKYKLGDDFELSQTFVFFWDKMERVGGAPRGKGGAPVRVDTAFAGQLLPGADDRAGG